MERSKNRRSNLASCTMPAALDSTCSTVPEGLAVDRTEDDDRGLLRNKRKHAKMVELKELLKQPTVASPRDRLLLPTSAHICRSASASDLISIVPHACSVRKAVRLDAKDYAPAVHKQALDTHINPPVPALQPAAPQRLSTECEPSRHNQREGGALAAVSAVPAVTHMSQRVSHLPSKAPLPVGKNVSGNTHGQRVVSGQSRPPPQHRGIVTAASSPRELSHRNELCKGRSDACPNAWGANVRARKRTQQMALGLQPSGGHVKRQASGPDMQEGSNLPIWENSSGGSSMNYVTTAHKCYIVRKDGNCFKVAHSLRAGLSLAGMLANLDSNEAEDLYKGKIKGPEAERRAEQHQQAHPSPPATFGPIKSLAKVERSAVLWQFLPPAELYNRHLMCVTGPLRQTPHSQTQAPAQCPAETHEHEGHAQHQNVAETECEHQLQHRGHQALAHAQCHAQGQAVAQTHAGFSANVARHKSSANVAHHKSSDAAAAAPANRADDLASQQSCAASTHGQRSCHASAICQKDDDASALCQNSDHASALCQKSDNGSAACRTSHHGSAPCQKSDEALALCQQSDDALLRCHKIKNASQFQNAVHNTGNSSSPLAKQGSASGSTLSQKSDGTSPRCQEIVNTSAPLKVSPTRADMGVMKSLPLMGQHHAASPTTIARSVPSKDSTRPAGQSSPCQQAGRQISSILASRLDASTLAGRPGAATPAGHPSTSLPAGRLAIAAAVGHAGVSIPASRPGASQSGAGQSTAQDARPAGRGGSVRGSTVSRIYQVPPPKFNSSTSATSGGVYVAQEGAAKAGLLSIEQGTRAEGNKQRSRTGTSQGHRIMDRADINRSQVEGNILRFDSYEVRVSTSTSQIGSNMARVTNTSPRLASNTPMESHALNVGSITPRSSSEVPPSNSDMSGDSGELAGIEDNASRKGTGWITSIRPTPSSDQIKNVSISDRIKNFKVMPTEGQGKEAGTHCQQSSEPAADTAMVRDARMQHARLESPLRNKSNTADYIAKPIGSDPRPFSGQEASVAATAKNKDLRRESISNSQLRQDSRHDHEADTGQDHNTDSRQHVRTDSRQDPRTDSTQDSSTGLWQDSRTDTRHDSRTDSRLGSRTFVRTDSRTDVRVDSNACFTVGRNGFCHATGTGAGSLLSHHSPSQTNGTHKLCMNRSINVRTDVTHAGTGGPGAAGHLSSVITGGDNAHSKHQGCDMLVTPVAALPVA